MTRSDTQFSFPQALLGLQDASLAQRPVQGKGPGPGGQGQLNPHWFLHSFTQMLSQPTLQQNESMEHTHPMQGQPPQPAGPVQHPAPPPWVQSLGQEELDSLGSQIPLPQQEPQSEGQLEQFSPP